MTTTPLPIAGEVTTAATHGSWCPKMCTFACPVAYATGRDEAVPWSFHREVTDLASGRSDPGTAWDRLALCNGCLACRDACTYEQDVPAQVLAGRAALVAAGHVPPHVQAALTALHEGRGPDGRTLPPLPSSDPDASTALVIGVAERPATLEGLRTVATRAGVAVRFVRGLGAGADLVHALGNPDAATAASTMLVADLDDATTVVATDPDALARLRDLCPDGVRVLDVASWLLTLLENGNLVRSSAPALGAVTWHDPPSLARVHDLVNAPRQVLRLLGGVVHEPEGHRAHTVAAGPGLAMEILAPEAAAQVTARRATQLAATGAPVVTVGGSTVTAFEQAGLDVRDLIEVVADRTQGRQAPPPPAAPPVQPTDAASPEEP